MPSATTDPLKRLRRICLELPETMERLSHAEPSWFVRDKKLFATYDDHHHDVERLAFWCAAPAGAQEMLVTAAPGRFFVPPYVGQRGWLGVRLDVPLDWEEVADLVEDALPHGRTPPARRRAGRRRGLCGRRLIGARAVTP